MSRNPLRRNLSVETLETRQLLSIGTTDLQQYALEQLNRARTNPSAAAVDVTTNLSRGTQDTFRFYGVDLDQTRREIAGESPEAPLAWNDRLAEAAVGHSQDMARNKFQSHEGSDGSKLEDRLDDAGYGDRATLGENAFAYAESVDNAMQAFLVDYGVGDKGHRNQIYRDNFTEVGVGIEKTNGIGVGPLVVTQNFGARNNQDPYLLGVVYDDKDGDGQYSVGEGEDDVTVVVRKLDDRTGQAIDAQEIRPWGSGGYQVQLAPGPYEVLAREGETVIRRQQVTVGEDNVKVDFVTSDRWEKSTYTPPAPAKPVVTATVVAPVAMPVQVATPVQAPVPAPAAAPTPVSMMPSRASGAANALRSAAAVNPVGSVTVAAQTETTQAPPKPSVLPIQQIFSTNRRANPARAASPSAGGFSWSQMSWRSWSGGSR